jgi:hypothetical protein
VTLHTLALVYLGLLAVSLLPGSSFKRKIDLRRDLDWGGPHVYLNLARSIVAAAIAVWVVL